MSGAPPGAVGVAGPGLVVGGGLVGPGLVVGGLGVVVGGGLGVVVGGGVGEMVGVGLVVGVGLGEVVGVGLGVGLVVGSGTGEVGVGTGLTVGKGGVGGSVGSGGSSTSACAVPAVSEAIMKPAMVAARMVLRMAPRDTSGVRRMNRPPSTSLVGARSTCPPSTTSNARGGGSGPNASHRRVSSRGLWGSQRS